MTVVCNRAKARCRTTRPASGALPYSGPPLPPCMHSSPHPEHPNCREGAWGRCTEANGSVRCVPTTEEAPR